MPQISKFFFFFFFFFKFQTKFQFKKIKIKNSRRNLSQSQTFQVQESSSSLKSTWIPIYQLSNQNSQSQIMSILIGKSFKVQTQVSTS